jgi:thiol-disulfide isomerase/thioredoxin
MTSLGIVKRLDVSKNKLTAIHFWATWCKPCVEEMPKLDQAQKKFYKDGLVIYPMSLDLTNVAKVMEFYETHKIHYVRLMMDANMSAFKSAKINGLPSTIFVNSKMQEIKRVEGPIDWQSKEIEDFITAQIALQGN